MPYNFASSADMKKSFQCLFRSSQEAVLCFTQYAVEPAFELQKPLCGSLYPLPGPVSSKWLVDHYLTVGSANLLPFVPAASRKAPSCCHADTYGLDIGLDMLHRVIYRKSRCYRTSRAVDVQLDILVRVYRIKIQQLSHYQACGYVVDPS